MQPLRARRLGKEGGSDEQNHTHPLAAIFFASRALPPISECPFAMVAMFTFFAMSAVCSGWCSGWTFSASEVGVGVREGTKEAEEDIVVGGGWGDVVVL